MPTVSVSVPHDKDPDEVVKRATPYIEKMVSDFEGHDLEMEWTGRQAEFSFKSMTFSISGKADVTDDQIAVDIELPLMAMIFKDKVEKAINKNLNRALADEEAS